VSFAGVEATGIAGDGDHVDVEPFDFTVHANAVQRDVRAYTEWLNNLVEDKYDSIGRFQGKFGY
jgi:hypothetical protein